jgi:hypothetical protein
MPANISLLLEGWNRLDSVALGPAPWFRISGNRIRQGPSGQIVAEFRNHQWQVGGRAYSRLNAKDSTCVRFEDASGVPTEAFGPFNDFSVIDGTIHLRNELFAKFVEETQLWHCCPTETYWPVIVISGTS